MARDTTDDLIQTAQAGDGDRLLDICLELLKRIQTLEHKIAQMERSWNNDAN